MTNDFPWRGSFEIHTRDGVTVIPNRITDAGLNALVQALDGASDCEIKYLALGTGSAAINDADTQLGTEVYRTSCYSQTKPSTGVVKSFFSVPADQCNVRIREIGIFAGSTATASANTGTLIARILWDYTKNSLEELQFIRTDTISR